MVNTSQLNRILPALICLLLAGAGILVAQTSDPEAYRETLIPGSVEREVKAFKDPFRGITTDGTVVPGLYSIQSTGVSTAPIVDAAKAFLKTLDAKQRDEAGFPALDIEWRKWTNQANYYRDGLWFEHMNEAQREAAFKMLGASLSAKGLKLTQDIMKTNETLGELNNNDMAKYGQWKYWISIMGEPSATEPWGWQLDGHHLIINYVILGDQVVMTPTFWGAEPTVAEDGKFKGVKVLVEETEIGLDMIQALTPEQQKKAIINVKKDGVNILAQGFGDNAIIPYAGIQATQLNDHQKGLLKQLIGLWVGKMRDEHARVRMEEVEKFFDETWFAWIGNTSDDAVFYYRIQNPVILIEFDHQRPQGLAQGLPHHFTHRNAYREHVHAVVRAPNGNDYGTDLLKQHYELHAHGTMGADGKPHWHTQ
jgi:hypothetical protein